ncbi:MAG: helix-turn-helix domain-containing protein [Halothiobacillaceae bacterium]
MIEPIQAAIQILGSQSALAAALGLKQAHVWHWLHKSKRCPAEQVIAVSKATAWRVTPHELRPDVYPHPDDGLPTSRRGKIEGDDDG